LSVGSTYEGIGSEKIRNWLQSKIVVLPLDRDLSFDRVVAGNGSIAGCSTTKRVYKNY